MVDSLLSNKSISYTSILGDQLLIGFFSTISQDMPTAGVQSVLGNVVLLGGGVVGGLSGDLLFEPWLSPIPNPTPSPMAVERMIPRASIQTFLGHCGKHVLELDDISVVDLLIISSRGAADESDIWRCEKP
jgi:hypothetical protein